MAQRKYDKKPVSRSERKRQDMATRQYPGGVPIPMALPSTYAPARKENKRCAGCKFYEEGFCRNWKAEVKSEYMCAAFALISENLESFSLKKDTYVSKQLKNTINTDFSEFIKPPIDEDVEQFFQIYREIFYDIPKRGENSHTTLVIDSTDHIEDYVDPKDTTILTLTNKIEQLQEQIEEEFSTQSHPFYPDGSILHVPYVMVGIMQNGELRDIRWSIWKEWSAAKPEFKDEDGETKSIRKIAHVFEDADAINDIPKGKPIRKLNDFNEYNFIKPIDVINFNELRNQLEQISLDLAEIQVLRNVLGIKAVQRSEGDLEMEDNIRNNNPSGRITSGTSNYG